MDAARRIAYPSGMDAITIIATVHAVLLGFLYVSLHLTMRDISRSLSEPTPMPIGDR